jgi:glycosyltransferase involved in cell wall biosynthesis
MKLLFLSDVPLNDPMSGAERVLNRQAVGLCQKYGNVAAISRSNNPTFRIEHRNIDGVHEACYSSNPDSFLKFVFNTLRVPSKIFDQLQSDDPFSAALCHQPFTSFPLLLQNRLRNIPILYIFHSPSHEEYLLSNGRKNNKLYSIAGNLRRMVEKYCLKRSEKIIVLSNYMKDKVMGIHHIPENRIEVNNGGVDLAAFKAATDRVKLKKELSLPEGEVHLLTIRNLEPRMGLVNLIKAIYLLRKQYSNIHLTIGGEGPQKKLIQTMVDEFGLSQNISILGFIQPDRLPDYYGAADFFIVPTEHLEGFGLVTVESLACGTPVLGTPVGGTVEILSGLHQGFLFNDISPESMAEGIHKTIDQFFADKGAYHELRRKCRKYAEDNYSWERHLNQLQSAILDQNLVLCPASKL